MSYIPGANLTFVAPASPAYLGLSVSDILNGDGFPEVYTSTGPLPVENGLAFSQTAFVFLPDYVTEGNFDCGIFGSEA